MGTFRGVQLFVLATSCLEQCLQCPHLREIRDNSTVNVTLNIIGLFAMTGDYPAGLSYLPAALLAIKHINGMPDILPGYRLQINAHDTKCDESHGLDAFYNEVYNPNRTSIMALGGTCSHVTEATAMVSKLWGLMQISYSAMSPHLSDKSIFPYFFRVMTPEQNLTEGRIRLFREFGWKKVHIVYQNLKLFSTLAESLKLDLEKENIEVASSEMFTTLKPRETVLFLKKKDSRIIILNMYEENARQVVCAVYHLEGSQTWYKKTVWLFPFFYDRHWMFKDNTNNNCTGQHILEVIGNYFSIGTPAFIKNDTYQAVNGLSPPDFYNRHIKDNLYSQIHEEIPAEFLSLYNDSYMNLNDLFCKQRAPEAYDAMWVIAFALNNTLTSLIADNSSQCLEDFSYKDESFSKRLYWGMMNVTFNSVSGKFFFQENGERTTGIEIWQYSSSSEGNITVVGSCSFSTPANWDCQLNRSTVQWRNGIVPVDGIQIKNRTIKINLRIVCTLSSIASLGIILSCCLLVFNIVKRSHRVIKMSSPRLNNVILFGCILSYSTVLILDVREKTTYTICVVRTFTLVLSFSLVFGALFAKTWRVYEIFTAGAKVLNTRMLRDSSLFLIVTILILINCVTLVVWLVASPQKPKFVNISTTLSSDEADVLYNNVFQRCDSAHRLHFTWALVAIQGVVMLLGTYLAIQTRKVAFPELNDSKWIAMCIYNVVVLGPVGVIVVMVTEEKPEINYALEAGIIILVTTMTLCLIFVPKIIAYRKHNLNHTERLDITLKVRNMNQILGVFTLDPGLLRRRAKAVEHNAETSSSCEASQQTDSWDPARLTRCPCTLKVTRIPLDECRSCRCLNNDENCEANERQTSTPPLFDNLKKISKSEQKTLKLGANIDSSSAGVTDVLKYLHKSKSESCLLELLDYKTPTKLTAPRSQARIKYNSQASPLGISASNDSKNNNNCEDSTKIVFNTLKVKADLRVSSTLGLIASWKDGRSEINNAEQICELLDRLKQAVEA